jgi:hypothetical protein
MADLTPVIETMENRWMRAWVNRDPKALKAITASSFIFLTGSKPPAILDRRSWLDAMGERFDCTSYRFFDIYVRDLGTTALFTARLELDATLDGNALPRSAWVTDLWQRGRVRRGWKLKQRILSRPDDSPGLPKAIRALQLWK